MSLKCIIVTVVTALKLLACLCLIVITWPGAIVHTMYLAKGDSCSTSVTPFSHKLNTNKQGLPSLTTFTYRVNSLLVSFACVKENCNYIFLQGRYQKW